MNTHNTRKLLIIPLGSAITLLALTACSGSEPRPQSGAVDPPFQVHDGAERKHPRFFPDIEQKSLAVTKTTLDATFSHEDAEATIKILKGGPRLPDFIFEEGVDSPYEFDYGVMGRDGQWFIEGFRGGGATNANEPVRTQTGKPESSAAQIHEDLFLAQMGVAQLRLNSEIESQFGWALDALENTVGGIVDAQNLIDPPWLHPKNHDLQRSSNSR